MAGDAGWYIGRIETSSVATAKGGTSPEIQDTVFQWTNANAKPTVATANITGLTAIVGGPYPTRSAALNPAQADKNTTTGAPGTGGKPGVTTSTVNSSNGHLPNPLSGLAAIGAFFSDLSSRNTWIRVAKVVVGGAVLLIGVSHMTGTQDAVNKGIRAVGSVPVPGLGLAAKGAAALSAKASSGGKAVAAKTRAGSIKDVGRAVKGK